MEELVAAAPELTFERDDGTIELLFGQPLSRPSYFIAVTLVRLAILVVPLLVLMPAMAI